MTEEITAETNMTIGRYLADLREQTGCTVEELSEATRIRVPVIEAIEHDDYRPCGGDFYARGHIRAMARCLGADPAPLLQAFDAGQEYGDAARSPGESLAGRGSRGFGEPPRVNWTLLFAVASLAVLILGMMQAFARP